MALRGSCPTWSASTPSSRRPSGRSATPCPRRTRRIPAVIAGVDRRLEANLDGLRIAGGGGLAVHHRPVRGLSREGRALRRRGHGARAAGRAPDRRFCNSGGRPRMPADGSARSPGFRRGRPARWCKAGSMQATPSRNGSAPQRSPSTAPTRAAGWPGCSRLRARGSGRRRINSPASAGGRMRLRSSRPGWRTATVPPGSGRRGPWPSSVWEKKPKFS